jgi:hypothetical protein
VAGERIRNRNVGRGLEETLTLNRVNVSCELDVSFKTTSLIERDGAARGEDAARDAFADERPEVAAVRVGAVSMERQFHRPKACRHLPLPKQAP